MRRVFSLVFLAAWLVGAQTPVRIPVIVVERQEQFVRSLTAADFRITEDGKEQRVTGAEIKAEAISLGIVSDRSRSVDSAAPTTDYLVQGLAALIQSSNPDDEFFVVLCSTDAVLACDFTRDAGRIIRAFAERTRGGTALWDAVFDALTHLDRAKNTKRAILVVSDGEDNNSRRGPAELEKPIRRSATPIFFLNLGQQGNINRSVEGPNRLRSLALNSGGAYKEIQDNRNAGSEILWIRDSLRAQYTLSFTSTNAAHDGKWRKVGVKVIPHDGAKHLQVLAPAGYYSR